MVIQEHFEFLPKVIYFIVEPQDCFNILQKITFPLLFIQYVIFPIVFFLLLCDVMRKDALSRSVMHS